MINYIQILVALGALLMEYESFSNAKLLSTTEDRKELWKDILSNYPFLIVIFMMISMIGYAILPLVWALSSEVMLRAAGTCLVSLAAISLAASRVPRLKRIWHTPVIYRIQSALSSICLGVVIYTKASL